MHSLLDKGDEEKDPTKHIHIYTLKVALPKLSTFIVSMSSAKYEDA
jgi:hypothetical protein